MKVDFVQKVNISTAVIVLLESESSDFLQAQLLNLESKGMMPDQKLLQTSVSFTDASPKKVGNSSWITSVSNMVSLIYETTLPTSMIAEKMLGLALSDNESLDFSFTNESYTVYFEPTENDTSVLYTYDDSTSNGDSSTSPALVVAISILSIMLVVVSGVLLYISGCLETCKAKCINCLFEEVVDEEFVLAHNSSFQTKSHPTYEEEEDVKSVTTSPAPTNASGMLGAQYHQVSPMLAGLGVKTPSKLDSGSMMTYDIDELDTTPMSQATNPLPLGITSMRKMPQPESPDAQRGLTGMIMGRFAGNMGKKL